MKALADVARKKFEREPLDEQRKPSYARLWLGRVLWFMVAASTYVLLIEGNRAGVVIEGADGEKIYGPAAAWEVVFDFWLPIGLALVGAMGLPRSFQYISGAVSAAAGKVREKFGGSATGFSLREEKWTVAPPADDREDEFPDPEPMGEGRP